MRLLNTTTHTLTPFPPSHAPPYAILSHTWSPSPNDEVSYQDLVSLSRSELAKKKGWNKIRQTCTLAKKSGIEWAWVDTCCIDKTSSAELTEAINSMWGWYKGATVCFAWLEDLESLPVPKPEGVGEGKVEGGKGKGGEKGDGKDGKEGRGENGHGHGHGKKDGHGHGHNARSTRISNSHLRPGEKEEWWEDDSESNVSTTISTNISTNISTTTGTTNTTSTSTTTSHTQSTLLQHLPHAQAVSLFRSCRWFTRGWTLQELIAPSRMGFYNSRWEFVGEKSALTKILSSITQISESVLDNSALLPTIPAAQRMSWASSRVTTRPEDMAYCLLGIFDVQIPLLYGEGEKKAFGRLQEEIVRESNDFSLFAWRVDDEEGGRGQHQKHWGILAPSAREFATCGDIVNWGNPLYNAECLITSKGLRITPAPGDGLRSGSAGVKGTYILDLGCYRRGDKEKAIGVFLQQHGADLYCRVRPMSLPAWSTGPGVKQPELAKNRLFYVTKTVSRVASTMLGSSHRWAFDLSHVFRAMQDIKFCPLPSQFQPEESWDGERMLFLSQGSRNFECCATFVTTRRDGLGALRILVWCRLHLVHGGEGEAQASVKVEFDPPTEGKTDGDGFVKCKGSVKKGYYEGQPVFNVQVEASTSKLRALPAIIPFRTADSQMHKMARAAQMQRHEKLATAAVGRERYFNSAAASMSSSTLGK